MSDTKSPGHMDDDMNVIMLRHTREYWLTANRLNVGTAILFAE